MAFTPTGEQKDIIEADLVSQCVIACAGSGKTATAVRRMLEIRRRLGPARGYVALLSYSNVAVESFRSEYKALSHRGRDFSSRVVVATVDAFITSHIVLPHSAREMGCSRQPFLIRGGEPFLNGHKINNGTYPSPMRKRIFRVSMDSAGNVTYSLKSFKGPAIPLSKI